MLTMISRRELRREIIDLIGTIFRVGKVQASQVDNGVPVARVTYPDLNGMGSGHLQVLQRNTVGTQDHSVPRNGELVLTLHLPNGREDGFVLGSLYTPTQPSPSTSVKGRQTTFDDQAVISYEPSTSTFTANLKGTAGVTTVSDITINDSGKLTCTVNGLAKITANQINLNGVLIDSSGNVTIPGTLTVDSTSQFNANINVTGTGTASAVWKDSTGTGVSAS